MAESLRVSKLHARERRSAFSGDAPALAGGAGLPVRPYSRRGFPLPAWASFYADESALAVLVCSGESWRTVEKALAYGIAHADGRKLELVLPDHRPGEPGDALRATSIRSAFLDNPGIRIWTHDGMVAEPRALLDPVQVYGLLRGEALAGGELDLGDLASRVADLEDWADSHPHLTACHEKSHRTWRCQGLILLSIQRRAKGLEVKSGVHYSTLAPGRPLADLLLLSDRNLSPAELATIQARVQAGIADKHAGRPPGYREHWMQATLAEHAAEIGWSGRHRLEREFPARRPGGGTGYIDFLRLDDSGTVASTDVVVVFRLVGVAS
jgi:hypothetical protein